MLLAAAISVIVLFLVSSGLALRGQKVQAYDSGVSGVNENRSQVLLTGKNYSLNYEQEQEHLEEKAKEKEKQEDRQKKVEEQQQQITQPEPENKPENIVEREEQRREQERQETDPPEQEQTPRDDSGNKEQDDQERDQSPRDDQDSKDDGDGEGDNGPSNPDSGEDSGDSGPGDSDTPGPSEEAGDGDTEPGTDGGDDSGDGDEGDNPSENPDDPEAVTKNPIIECSLTDGETINSDTVSFTVRGIDYHKRPINNFYITVSVNGERISSGGHTDDGGYTYYADLRTGANEIHVNVSDEEGNTSSASYNLNADAESNELSDETVSLTLDLRSIGYGIPINTWERIYRGESLPHFIDRVLNEYGYSPYSRNGFNSGYYLERIYGINVSADSINIPDPILDYIDIFNPSYLGVSTGSLGQDDVYEKSGWMYMYNGTIKDQGMSSVSLMDGDEVVLMFTVHMGYEYDGTWFFYGDW